MKIGYILDSVDNGTIVLPEFQRGYVWSRDQVKGLMQSLYQRFPVGGLLIWNTQADATDLRGADAPGSTTVKLLLDGQQRVTSLYGVMRGAPPRFFEDPERTKSFTGLYFHLERETFEFYRPSAMADDRRWISVTDLMLSGPEKFTEGFSEIDGMTQSQLISYVNHVQKLHGIRDIDLHDENISGDDMTVDVVVDIFNRVNSGGTKLSKGDLALARICAIRPPAREELRNAIAGWKEAGFDFSLEWLLRCVNVIVTGEARFEAMRTVSSEDFGVGLKKASQAIDFLLNLFSTRLGLDHDRVLMGRYGIPAMVQFVADAGGAVKDLDVQNDLLYWYIHQAMWGRYSGSTETVLARDLAALASGGMEGLISELGRSRGSLDVRPEDFDTQTVGSRFYPILYLLTRVNDARDFCTGMALSANLLGKGSKLEVHHIFPKAVLYEAGYARQQVNAVANFAFLTGDCNRKISDRTPIDYFEEVDGEHVGALTSQWITDDRSMWEVDRYAEFLTDRRARLAAATNELLASLRAGSSTSVVGSSGGVGEDTDVESEDLRRLIPWCDSLGLARPDVPAEIVDPESGEALVYADAAWLDGMQTGRTERVALVLDPDAETEARLGALGFRFFRSHRELHGYVEELLNADLDGDDVIGEPDDAGTTAPGASDARTFYVNYGGGLGREWEDARKHGFISAGGGAHYSKPLRKLRVGDELLVYLPGHGYGGIARVTRPIARFDEALIEVDGALVPLAGQALDGPYEHDVDEEDPHEYVVGVRWINTSPEADAFYEPGLFANPATVVAMRPDAERHRMTIDRVREHFGSGCSVPNGV